MKRHYEFNRFIGLPLISRLIARVNSRTACVRGAGTQKMKRNKWNTNVYAHKLMSASGARTQFVILFPFAIWADKRFLPHSQDVSSHSLLFFCVGHKVQQTNSRSCAISHFCSVPFMCLLAHFSIFNLFSLRYSFLHNWFYGYIYSRNAHNVWCRGVTSVILCGEVAMRSDWKRLCQRNRMHFLNGLGRRQERKSCESNANEWCERCAMRRENEWREWNETFSIWYLLSQCELPSAARTRMQRLCHTVSVMRPSNITRAQTQFN